MAAQKTRRDKDITDSSKHVEDRVGYFRRLGPLRTALVATLALLVIMAPFAGEETASAGWRILPTLVAPALVPMLYFVVFFDIVMSRVVMSVEEKRARYDTIFWTYIVLFAATALAWGPVFARLF